MASSTFLKDLEENFFLCPVCFEQFKGPKMLPCLHRYCSNCLRTVVNRSNDGTIECPMCKQQFAIPDNGIDGFKTDFHMRNVVEFIHLQKAFEDKNVKECVSCSKQTNVSAYCFKCKDFLCEQCYNVHITNKMFTDHKSRTLKLDNTERRNITLEKLATLTENPGCRTHVEKKAELCCSTCLNEPICMVCTYSKHKGHDLHDVTELASTERELLEAKIAELRKLTSTFYEIPKKVEATKQKLNENVSLKTDKLINQHKNQVNKIKNWLEIRKNEKEQGLADIERRRKDEERKTNLNFDKEINELNKKYDKLRKATERKYNNESQLFEGGCDKLVTELVHRLKTLDDHLKTLTESKERLMEKQNTELTKISESCDQVIERHQNFTAISSSILASENEWTQVQSIPDIRAACEPLIEEMRREYQQLDSLSDINIKDMPNVAVAEVTISDQEQSVVDVEGLKSMNFIHGIAMTRNGNIVISGKVSKEYSHITVINTKRKIQRQDKFKRVKKCNVDPSRYCCYLSECTVATVCVPDEIGTYDVRDGSHNKKYISDVVRGWLANRIVWCVTNDPVRNHIIVGTNSRYVYIFDDQLNYIRTVTLPDVINGVNDITLHAGTLLICDYKGKRAYAVTMEGSESKLMYEFRKPDVDGTKVGPYRVCTDKNDFIYMLWRVYISSTLTYTLVQYSQDDRRIVTTRKVDNDAYCLTTVEVGESENLLIATYSQGKLHEYGLTVK